MTQKTAKILKEEHDLENDAELKCGIIMPIAAMNEYTESHWQDVKNIIIEATQEISEYKFKTDIVSDSDGEVNIIHKNIISNIYNSDIVICDISGRNPNVLFELGMRLTFDKPTIIIKDNETDYIFDTSSIETLTYPRDLRFGSIVHFKNQLATKIIMTYRKKLQDPAYSTFLGHFGEFKVPVLNQTAVTDPQQIILDQIFSLKEEIKSLKRENSPKSLVEYDKLLTLSSKEVEIHTYNRTAFEYIASTHDLREPRTIYHSDEFQNFFKSLNVNPQLSTITTVAKLNAIKAAQESVLSLDKKIASKRL